MAFNSLVNTARSTAVSVSPTVWLFSSILFILMFVSGEVLAANSVSKDIANLEPFQRAKIDPDLIIRLQKQLSVPSIIIFNPPQGNAASYSGNKLNRYALAGRAIAAQLSAAEFELTHAFSSIPAFVGRVKNARGLSVLSAMKNVRIIQQDHELGLHLSQSVPQIGANVRHWVPNDGMGVTVAVLDTGIDADHPALAASLLHEECFYDCPNGTNRQSGTGSALDENGHGTHVTGIIAASGSGFADGVSPAIQVLSLRVCNDSGGCSTSAMLAALDFIAVNPQYDVKAINISIGSLFAYATPCASETDATGMVVEVLKQMGVTTFASSGNNGSSTGISSPACLTNIISVGSVSKSDVHSSFSNSADYLDMVAPGGSIKSSNIGGGTTTLSGTSMASPHAVGCAALLIEAGEATTPDAIKTRLTTSSILVTNSANGLSHPRLDCRLSDADSDGMPDHFETLSCTNIFDADTDDDGLSDGLEDLNFNGITDAGETDPCNPDTDGDGIQDGTEAGVSSGIADPDADGPLEGTNNSLFVPDADPATTTDPTNPDTDNDGLNDGIEDTNGNGFVDAGEFDPLDNIVSLYPFLTPEYYASIRGPQIISEDVDNDGAIDLVVANQENDTVSVMYGNGRGQFLPAVYLSTGGENPSSVVASDFNNDGIMDIASANFLSVAQGSFSIFIGTGDGQFNAGIHTQLTGLPKYIEVADLNNDNNKDVIIANERENKVAIFLGNGDGTFQTVQYYLTDFFTLYVKVNDINSDGSEDLLILQDQYGGDITGNMLIALGNGDGTFGVGSQKTINPSKRIGVSDINRDGHKDIVDTLRYYPGNGDGTFQDGQSYIDNFIFQDLVTAQIEDIDADGVDDVVLIDSISSQLITLNGDTSGNLNNLRVYKIGIDQPGWLSAEDFNGDGLPDLAFITIRPFSNLRIAVMMNAGDGTFQAVTPVDAGVRVAFLDANDMNNDGVLDLVAGSNFGFEGVRVLIGDGTGKFDSVFSQTTNSDNSDDGILGDYNNDSFLDFVTVTNYTTIDPVTFEENRFNGISILLGQGDGRLGSASEYSIDIDEPRNITSGDYDGDGELDLVATIASINTNPRIISNDGSGIFGSPIEIPVPEDAAGTTTADVNQDGHLDLIFTKGLSELDPGTMRIMLGDGAGNFTADAIYNTGGSRPLKLAADDFNNDNFPDIAIAHRGSRYIPDSWNLGVLISKADGTYHPVVNYYAGDVGGGSGAGTGPYALDTGDLNNDGLIDIAVVNFEEGTVWVYLGRGDGTFADGKPLGAGNEPRSIVIADLNDDGFSDIAVGTNNDRDIALFFNQLGFIDRDNDNFIDVHETGCTSRFDADTDDDGLADGDEDLNQDGVLDIGETDPCNIDTDGDGIQDGTELGIIIPVSDPDGNGPFTATDLSIFVPDADPSTTTNPLDIDTDDDGIADGVEDANANGVFDLIDGVSGVSQVQALSAVLETDACAADSDGDGIQDGTESGLVISIPDPDGAGPIKGTDIAVFVPDADPVSTTSAINPDSDGDGFLDGEEDLNGNGSVDIGEANPLDNTSVPVIADGDLAPYGNPDGSINAADVLIALQLTLDQRIAGPLQYAHGDMNGDGVIDTVDLKLIQDIVMQN